jgi:uncharacterized membrane protein
MPFNIGPGELVVFILLAVPLAVPLVVIYLAVHWARTREQASPADPRAVLATRLAKGEITPQEFDTAMRALGFVAPPTEPPPPGPGPG